MTPKQTKFAMMLFKTKSQTEAYRQSYNVENMSESSIYNASYELAKNPEVIALVQRLEDDAALVATLDEAWVLKRYMLLANADPNELVESRVECCRYCHGVDHKYQWIDVEEWGQAVAAAMDHNARGGSSKSFTPRPIPSFDGGPGFWATNPPSNTCPHCFGKGVHSVHIHDTRKLSQAGRMLYAGVKQTANGPEIKMRDQDKALAFLASYLGLDKKVLEINPQQPLHTLSEITDDPVVASKTYAQLINGGAA